MFCPRCRSEYRAGFTRCGLCQVDLVDELPPEDAAFSSPEAMARTLADAELEPLLVGSHVELSKAQRFLAGQRLASVIAGEPERPAESGLHTRFFLMVAATDLERARTVVQERWREGALAQGLLIDDASALPEGTCPACGASVPATASECPDCGLFLGDGGAAG